MNLRRPLALLAVAVFLATAGWTWAAEEPAPEAITVPAVHQPTAGAPIPITTLAPKPVTADASSGKPAHPAWVDSPIEPTGRAKVARVEAGSLGVVVVLDGGLYQGLRDGMVCSVEHNGVRVVELMLVSTQAERSAGLITGQARDSVTGQLIEIVPGDNVRLVPSELF